MYFGIYGEDEVNNIVLNGKNSILISICSNSILKTNDLYKRILCLDIEDIITYKCVTDEFRMKLVNVFVNLNKFLLINDFDEVIVHCALGISRSPAIMICISRILGCYEIEKIVKDKFKNFNKIIVNEFEKFEYVKKEMDIDNVIFNGRFNNEIKDDYVIETIINEDKEFGLILRRKY